MTSTPQWPDELVTTSLVRYVDFPAPADPAGRRTFALITLDNGRDHTRPSTLGPGGLQSLDAALDQIEAHTPAVAAVAITGKPFVFCAGADLEAVGAIATEADARSVAELGHRVLGRLREFPVPTFAFINGAAMGGGLELALHCHFRTLSRTAGPVSFPQVFLGLAPCWGGTQLLPNLIGPAAAVEVIVGNALNQNTPLRPAQAAQLGIADVLLEPADFLVESLRWAVAVLEGAVAVARPAPDRGPAWAAAVAAGRALADARLHQAAPAAYRALDLIELARTATFADGTAAENDVLVELLLSEELRSGLYAFDLVNRRARRPTGAPDRDLARPVGKVGIVGAGLMARQLALLFVRELKVPVVLTDTDPARLADAISGIHGEIETLLARGRIDGDTAHRIGQLVTGAPTVAGLAEADFVIEAVFEELAVKRSVFADLEPHVATTTVFVTNTSSLSVTAMATGLQHPQRLAGLHFFNPVAVLPLVEVVRAESTDDATLATTLAVAAALKKSAVLVADAPAFVVNRLLTRVIGEVLAAVDEGTPIEVADSAFDSLGLPMSPFSLLALVGPPIALHVARTLHAELGDRFAVSPNLARLVEAGKPSVYLGSGPDRRLDPEVVSRFEFGSRPCTPEQIRDRALAALASEIALLLSEGVVSDVADIDLSLLLGAGWPFHLGGISPYLDRTGVSDQVISHIRPRARPTT